MAWQMLIIVSIKKFIFYYFIILCLILNQIMFVKCNYKEIILHRPQQQYESSSSAQTQFVINNQDDSQLEHHEQSDSPKYTNIFYTQYDTKTIDNFLSELKRLNGEWSKHGVQRMIRLNAACTKNYVTLRRNKIRADIPLDEAFKDPYTLIEQQVFRKFVAFKSRQTNSYLCFNPYNGFFYLRTIQFMDKNCIFNFKLKSQNEYQFGIGSNMSVYLSFNQFGRPIGYQRQIMLSHHRHHNHINRCLNFTNVFSIHTKISDIADYFYQSVLTSTQSSSTTPSTTTPTTTTTTTSTTKTTSKIIQNLIIIPKSTSTSTSTTTTRVHVNRLNNISKHRRLKLINSIKSTTASSTTTTTPATTTEPSANSLVYVYQTRRQSSNSKPPLVKTYNWSIRKFN